MRRRRLDTTLGHEGWRCVNREMGLERPFAARAAMVLSRDRSTPACGLGAAAAAEAHRGSSPPAPGATPAMFAGAWLREFSGAVEASTTWPESLASLQPTTTEPERMLDWCLPPSDTRWYSRRRGEVGR